VVIADGITVFISFFKRVINLETHVHFFNGEKVLRNGKLDLELNYYFFYLGQTDHRRLSAL
jgi:hypothetical protein